MLIYSVHYITPISNLYKDFVWFKHAVFFIRVGGLVCMPHRLGSPRVCFIVREFSQSYPQTKFMPVIDPVVPLNAVYPVQRAQFFPRVGKTGCLFLQIFFTVTSGVGSIFREPEGAFGGPQVLVCRLL